MGLPGTTLFESQIYHIIMTGTWETNRLYQFLVEDTKRERLTSVLMKNNIQSVIINNYKSTALRKDALTLISKYLTTDNFIYA